MGEIVMKYLAGILLFVSSVVYGAVGDLRIDQRNSTDTGNITRSVPFPASSADGIFWFNGSTVLPSVLTLGTNLSITSGVLNAAAGAQADWTAGSGPSQILNKPSFATIAFTGTFADLSSLPTTLAGHGITNAYTKTEVDTALAGKANVISINDSPGRSLVTTNASTGFQISASRAARVCYEGSFSTTSTIGGPASVTVFLETADTNSTTPADWTTKASQTYTNTITLAVVLNQVQSNNWSFCRDIPAAKYVRVRSGAISGTASATINATQQETQL